MSDESRPSTLKSAYELALEQLDSSGIGRPDQDALSEETRAAVAEIRRKAEAKLASLEILHGQRLAELGDPTTRQQAEQEYRAEKAGIIERRERDIDRLRASADRPDSSQS
jgi:hypothetical protein